jgi:hypothetical protein
MRRLDGHAEAASVRLSRTQITPSLLETSRSALSLLLKRTTIRPVKRTTIRPVIVFVLLSLAFGSAITFVVPPLRGPDEIAHFLRIYSYARGELLPATEVNGRKGVLVERTVKIAVLLHVIGSSGSPRSSPARPAPSPIMRAAPACHDAACRYAGRAN